MRVEIKLSRKQAQKLGVKNGSRFSRHLEKCCLLLVVHESFANAEKDLKMLTGIYLPHSTQHRLLERYEFSSPSASEQVEACSYRRRKRQTENFLFESKESVGIIRRLR